MVLMYGRLGFIGYIRGTKGSPSELRDHETTPRPSDAPSPTPAQHTKRHSSDPSGLVVISDDASSQEARTFESGGLETNSVVKFLAEGVYQASSASSHQLPPLQSGQLVGQKRAQALDGALQLSFLDRLRRDAGNSSQEFRT